MGKKSNNVMGYKELEKKIKVAISRCNKRNLVDVIKLEGFGSSNYECPVENATHIEHYVIDEFLHVYKHYNGTQPISYWISSGSMLKQEKDDFGEKTYFYNKTSGIQYSVSGIGNSVPYYGENYGIMDFISVLMPAQYDNEVCCGPVVNFLNNLYTPPTRVNFLAFYREGMDEFIRSGDLGGFIRNVQPKGEDQIIFDDLRTTFDRLDILSLNIEKESQNKKGLLMKLLGINIKLDMEIDAFDKGKGR